MPCLVTLKSRRSYPLMTQIVLCPHRVMHTISGRHIGCECSQVSAACQRKIIRTKGHNGIWVCCITRGVMNVGGEGVDISQIPRSGRESCSIIDKRRVESGV